MAVIALQVLPWAGLWGDEGAVQDIVGVGAAHRQHRLGSLLQDQVAGLSAGASLA